MPKIGSSAAPQVTTPQEITPQSGARQSCTETKHEAERRALTLAPAKTRTSGALALHLSVLSNEGDRPAPRTTPRVQRIGNVVSAALADMRAVLNRRRAQVGPAALTMTLETMPPVIKRHIAGFLRARDESSLGAASRHQRELLEPVVASRMELLAAVQSLNVRYDRLYLRHAELRVEHEVLDAENSGVNPHDLGPVHSQRTYRMALMERRRPTDPELSRRRKDALGKELTDLETNMRMNCRAVAIAREEWNRLNIEGEMPKSSQPRDPFEPVSGAADPNPGEAP